MNPHATLVHHRCWRLILAVATDSDDAQRVLAAEVGQDPDSWYQIALVTALQVAQLLDAEYMAAQAMHLLDAQFDAEYMAAAALRSATDKEARAQGEEARAQAAADRDTLFADPGITDRAREYTVGRIERRLADALDTPPTDP